MTTKGIHRLKVQDIPQITKPGLYSDGLGLYLRVNEGGAQSWQYRYSWAGKIYTLGLGSTAERSAAKARTEAVNLRAEIQQGRNPYPQRRAAWQEAMASTRQQRAQQQAVQKEAKATAVRELDIAVKANRVLALSAHRAQKSGPAQPGSFRAFAESYMAQQSGWDAKTRTGWEQRLATYAYPIIGNVKLAEITLVHVLQVVEPIWRTKTDTADRTRRHIAMIIDAAIMQRAYPASQGNPARGIGRILGAPGTVTPVEARKMMPYAEVPAFVQQLRQRSDVSAAPLEFLILAASRTTPVRLATWAEFNAARDTWTIPADHMKGKRGTKEAHKVPLSTTAQALIRRIEAERGPGDLVFPSFQGGVLSDMALQMLVRRMGYQGQVDTHGFRASFDTWAQEEADFPEEVRDRALAHVIQDKSKRAYRRGDQFNKRRPLMEAWGRYCDGSTAGGELVHFKRGA